MSIRVLVADDHKIVRDGLRALIEKEEDIELVGEAKDGRAACTLARQLAPDVVVLDIVMPGLNGIEAARRMVAEMPGVKVIALSMHSDRRFVIEMLRAGAAGYLLKDAAFDELARAIRTVAAGETYLCPAVAGIVVEDYVEKLPVAAASPLSVLSPREREVLQLLAEGKTTKQIALDLHLSSKTIESHCEHIKQNCRD